MNQYTAHWAIRLKGSSQKDGNYYTYEIVDDLDELTDLVKKHGATEAWIVRATSTSIAKSIFEQNTSQ